MATSLYLAVFAALCFVTGELRVNNVIMTTQWTNNVIDY